MSETSKREMPALVRAHGVYARARNHADVKQRAFVQAIVRERERGRSLAEIGAAVGLTKQRIDQLLKAANKSSSGS